MNRILLALSLSLAACEGDPGAFEEEDLGLARTFTRGNSGLRMYAVGDSYFDFNTGRDTPEWVYRELDATGFNAAEGGAVFLDPSSIPGQYQDRNTDWVLISGGGNDLNDACGCGPCNQTMNQIVTRAGTGAMSDFVRARVAEGNRVAIVGYLPLVPGRPEFIGCEDELAELNSRITDLVDGYTVLFIDPADIATPGDLSLYSPDLIHPSRRGSRLIGQYVAQRINDVL